MNKASFVANHISIATWFIGESKHAIFKFLSVLRKGGQNRSAASLWSDRVFSYERRTITLRRTFTLLLIVILAVAALLAQIQHSARASNLTWQQFIYSGPAGSRPYFVYTPETYQVGTAVPLIVMLHGCLQTALDFAIGTQMNQLAEQYHFIVAYPQQTSLYNPDLCWNWFDPSNQVRGRGEPAILAGIVQEIESHTDRWTIDRQRIYVTGLSAGAAMSVLLGATYPHIFAAIGVHSGAEYGAITSPLSGGTAFLQGGPDPIQQGKAAFAAMGHFARVVPTIVFHGTKDLVSAPINGKQVVQQWMETDFLASHGTYQAKFNAPSSTRDGQVPGGHSYTVYTWNDTNGNEVQEYWVINGMGHAWSGGNPYNFTDLKGPSASQAMYAFFMNHPMNAS
jgi:poly(hydroxyalkanoate) depolymerase family esterase